MRPRGEARVARRSDSRRGGAPSQYDRGGAKGGFGPKRGDRGSSFRGRGRGRGDFGRGKRGGSPSDRGGWSPSGFRGGRGKKRHFNEEETATKKRKFGNEIEEEEDLDKEVLSEDTSLDDSELEDEESLEMDTSGEEVPAEGVVNNGQGESDLESDDEEELEELHAKTEKMMKANQKLKGKEKKPAKMETKDSSLATKDAAAKAKGKNSNAFAKQTNQATKSSKMAQAKKGAAAKVQPVPKVEQSDEEGDESDELELGSEELSEEMEEESEESEDMEVVSSPSNEGKPSPKKSAKTGFGKVSPNVSLPAGKPNKGLLKKQATGKGEVDKKPAKVQSVKPDVSTSKKPAQQELGTEKLENKLLMEETARIKRRDSCRLFVNKLPKDVNIEDIKSAVPEVVDFFSPFRHEARFGFLVFSNEAVAVKQYGKLKDNLRIKDKDVTIDYCGEKSAKGTRELSPVVHGLQLYVSDLPAQMNNTELKKLFPKAKHVEVMQRSRYGLVTFNTAQDAREAFNSGSNMSLNGVPITVLYSRPQRRGEKQEKKEKQGKEKAKKKGDKLDKSISEAQSATPVKSALKEEVAGTKEKKTPEIAKKKAVKPTKSLTPPSATFADMKSDDDDDEGVESVEEESDLDEEDDESIEDLGTDDEDEEVDDDDEEEESD